MEAEIALNGADTAWVLVSSVLVLMMTLPGLSLFYAGMAQSRHVLSVFLQCLSAAFVASVIWFLFGYALTFNQSLDVGSPLSLEALRAYFASYRDGSRLVGTVPLSVFMLFQASFAMIAPAIIVGSLIERMKFVSFLCFVVVWVVLVYLPVCHAVWGGGILAEHGHLDFAGGLVVHFTTGVSGLVVALMLGRRRDFPRTPPHNLVMVAVGACLLFVGWFGFNAGSSLVSGSEAGLAAVLTLVAGSVASLSWGLLELCLRGRVGLLGMVTGLIAGLVGVTPAAGFVGLGGAFTIGIVSSVSAYFTIRLVKGVLRIDDSLDVFAVHGVSGFVGSILLVFFLRDGVIAISVWEQLWVQLSSSLLVLIYVVVVSVVVLSILKRTLGLRVSREAEIEGLDYAEHSEVAYHS